MSGFSSFLRRLKVVSDPLSSRRLIGEDFMGNKYYEVLASTNAPPKRVIEPKASVEVSDYDPEHVPVQWKAWLMRRRNEPPTLEELKRDEERRMAIQERARLLEIQYAEQRQAMLEDTQKQVEARGNVNVQETFETTKDAEVEPPVDPWKSHEPLPPTSQPSAHPTGSFEAYKPGVWQPKPAKRVG